MELKKKIWSEFLLESKWQYNKSKRILESWKSKKTIHSVYLLKFNNMFLKYKHILSNFFNLIKTIRKCKNESWSFFKIFDKSFFEIDATFWKPYFSSC